MKAKTADRLTSVTREQVKDVINNTILVYKSGTLIEIKINKMPAIINSCKIELNNIIYKASYFANDEYKETDLFEYEFNVIESKGKQTIGFK